MSTEKRLFLFLVLTFMVLSGYAVLMEMYGPKRPLPVAQEDAKSLEKNADKKTEPLPADSTLEKPASEKPAREKPGDEKPASEKTAEKPTAEAPATEPAADAVGGTDATKLANVQPHRVIALGSYELPSGGNPLLVTFNSRGGTLERVELVGRQPKGKLRYRDLDHTSGYLGNLSLTMAPEAGCRIHVVPAGTPAAKAQATGIAGGLQPGDVLISLNGKAVDSPASLETELSHLQPRDTVKLIVERGESAPRQSLEFTTQLDVRPFQLIKPEPLEKGETRPHPESLQLSLRDASRSQAEFLDRLQNVEWETKVLDQPVPTVEFRYEIPASTVPGQGLPGAMTIVKRYRMGTREPNPARTTGIASLPHHIDFEIELRNVGDKPQSVAYRLDGTNGLPTEGWWYLTKIHPRWFQSAGARDVVLRTDSDGHRLVGSSAILSKAKKEEDSPLTPLFSEKEPIGNRSVSYIGVDTQYFAAALLPISSEAGSRTVFARGEALVWGDPGKKPKGWERTANTSYQLTSEPIGIDPGNSVVQRFQLFLGPKDPDVLASYKLGDWIYYGWFGWIATFLSTILHFFFAIVGNYGIAIILLTVLVRSCMFPISRTAARNAAMMQELAPEMRKIAEKYKNNLEARGKAQQELFRSHSYNPLSGCWLMFLQLPVFIGLYRCLAVDIELRQAPLIPGLDWCSNLAGPDKLFFWKNEFFAYFTDESGWLGPYFNVLPIFTIGLFLLHQKLFTPPATDEQTEMQMKMMKFMTVFMGVMFYKVPAGLCLYFITSSLWGIAERKLLPKPTPKKNDEKGGGGFSFASLLKPRTPPPDGNGSSRKKELERKMRKNNGK